MLRRSIWLAGPIALSALALSASAGAVVVVTPANSASLGLIPDSPGPTCGTPGSPRAVTFSVAGVPDKITDVAVSMTFNPIHGWGGDIQAVLIGPNSASHALFGRTGELTAAGCGDGSDLAGPYTFSDTAVSDWWNGALVAGNTLAITSGSYRTSVPGGAAGGGAQTSMTPAFASADPNGTWTLVFTDFGLGDTGTVSAASLTLTLTDTKPPQTTFTKKPKKTTTSQKARFKFTSNETGSTFQCKLDNKAYKGCKSPKTLKVKPGKHTLRVRAVDKAGHKDATPAKFSWTVKPS